MRTAADILHRCRAAGLMLRRNGNQLDIRPARLVTPELLAGIRAAKPDLVFVMSYPNDSVAIVRAVNEIGVGESVKMFGGGGRADGVPDQRPAQPRQPFRG